jgi:hypothetical protein
MKAELGREDVRGRSNESANHLGKEWEWMEEEGAIDAVAVITVDLTLAWL